MYASNQLTIIPGKILKDVMTQSNLKHFENKALITRNPSGFVINLIKLTLFHFFNHVTSLLDCGNTVGIIYLDFSKAFDKLPYDTLISKLIKCGLDSITIKWIIAGLKTILK